MKSLIDNEIYAARLDGSLPPDADVRLMVPRGDDDPSLRAALHVAMGGIGAAVGSGLVAVEPVDGGYYLTLRCPALMPDDATESAGRLAAALVRYLTVAVWLEQTPLRQRAERFRALAAEAAACLRAELSRRRPPRFPPAPAGPAPTVKLLLCNPSQIPTRPQS